MALDNNEALLEIHNEVVLSFILSRENGESKSREEYESLIL